MHHAYGEGNITCAHAGAVGALADVAGQKSEFLREYDVPVAIGRQALRNAEAHTKYDFGNIVGSINTGGIGTVRIAGRIGPEGLVLVGRLVAAHVQPGAK